MNVQKFKRKYANYETKRFSVLRNNSQHFLVFLYFIQFHETIETRRNSDLFHTVLYFAKQKKIPNCPPYLQAKRSHWHFNLNNCLRFFLTISASETLNVNTQKRLINLRYLYLAVAYLGKT